MKPSYEPTWAELDSQQYAQYLVELRDEVALVLSTLTANERTIICLHFGIGETGNGLERTQKEVAHKLAHTTPAIYQAEKKALRKLRHITRARSLLPFLRPSQRANVGKVSYAEREKVIHETTVHLGKDRK